MDLHVFGAKDYDDPSRDYGDCILLIDTNTAIVFDCGSEEHAKKVEKYLDDNGIDKATVFLSHNDDDHFKGIPYLIEQKRVDKLFTVLLLKYTKELQIDVGRRNLDSIGEAIKELYDNIESLSGKVKLRDVYEHVNEFPTQISFVGPEFDYMIEAAAKGLDTREGNVIDGETITNASSLQLQIKFGDQKIFLTGDCTAKAIPESEKLEIYSYIQLPHHGKPEHAEEIFNRCYSNNDIIYIVSDNTGDTNGGSDNLNKKGHQIRNTKEEGDIKIYSNSPITTRIPNRVLGI